MRVQPRKECQDLFASLPKPSPKREVGGYLGSSRPLWTSFGSTGAGSDTLSTLISALRDSLTGSFPKESKNWEWAIQRTTRVGHPADHLKMLTRVDRLCPTRLAQAALSARENSWVPSRVIPAPDPEVRALVAVRPRRRDECSLVISSEAEKRLRS